MSYANTNLLLPMFGANAGTDFPDCSPVRKTIIRAGATLPTTVTAQSVYYGSSGYFPTHAAVSMSRLAVDLLSAIGTGPFCIETWIRITSAAQLTFFISTRTDSAFSGDVNSNTGFIFEITTNRELQLRHGATVVTNTSSSLVALNTWTHVALDRDESNTARMFIGGSSAITPFSLTRNFSNRHAHIGGINASFASSDRNMSDFRITYESKYTADFTPPARLVGTINNSAVGASKILDINGDPAERVVFAVPRVAPTTVFSDVSNASGEFEIWAPAGLDHSVVALADESDSSGELLRNDIVHRVIPV